MFLRARFFAGACFAVTLISSVARAQIDAESVRQSIGMGVEYLQRAIRGNGVADGENFQHPGGVTSLAVLALVNAGVDPKDGQIQASLDYLRGIEPTTTYATALQTMVFCLAEPNNKPLIRRNVQWLEETQLRPTGGWSYGFHRQQHPDYSNSQFALLALHEAEKVGVSAKEKTWRLARKHFLDGQHPQQGSWGYMPQTQDARGSMTCAGIAALIITNDKFRRTDAKVGADGNVQCCGVHEEDENVKAGLDWLARNFSVHRHPGAPGRQWLFYYLYALERVGRLTNQRLIGEHDWYRAGAEALVGMQNNEEGSWIGDGMGEDNPVVATSMALLFLAKGRRPVLISKVIHEPLDDWNRHRSDVANIVAHAESQWDREMTWQTIDVAAARTQSDLGELFDALVQTPVLWISGKLAPEFTDAQVAVLRRYVDQGGFIFAESCCGGEDFDAGFRELVERLFPEPEYRLKLLSPDHGVWHAEGPVDAKHVRPLYGIDIGCRTSVVYCPDNAREESGRLALSCYWELARPGRGEELPKDVRERVDASLTIGLNVLAYATNREPKYKLEATAPSLTGIPNDDVERAKVAIPIIQHNGNWDVAPAALNNLLLALSNESGLRVDLKKREFGLLDERLFEYHAVFMHGRNSFTWSDEERARLRSFIENGGMLFADAVCASPQFAQSFRDEMQAIFPEWPLAEIPPEDELFTDKYGGATLRMVKRREPGRRNAAGGIASKSVEGPPILEGFRVGDRYGVILSPYDLSCALERHAAIECPGYSREDAARIGINVLLYSLH